jgi:hypothetical protein
MELTHLVNLTGCRRVLNAPPQAIRYGYSRLRQILHALNQVGAAAVGPCLAMRYRLCTTREGSAGCWYASYS